MNFSKIKPTESQIKDAKKMGVQAFNGGKKIAPALNPAFLAWASSTGARIVDLMDGYTSGWSVAMLAEGQTTDFPSVQALAGIMGA